VISGFAVLGDVQAFAYRKTRSAKAWTSPSTAKPLITRNLLR